MEKEINNILICVNYAWIIILLKLFLLKSIKKSLSNKEFHIQYQ